MICSAHRSGSALIDALNSVGVQGQISPYNAVSGNPMAMHILVGPKTLNLAARNTSATPSA